ncbi:MAG TPA: glycosyltransferase family 4 protein, partial [Blastocatellia bacterium]
MSQVVFLNPWDRLIGPNRYLFEILRCLPDLARSSTVVFDQTNDAQDEYQEIGCGVEVWPEISPIHPRANLGNALKMASVHTAGLARMVNRLRSHSPGLVVSNTENLWVGGMASKIIGVPHMQVFHALTFKDRLGSRPFLMKSYLRFLSCWSRSFVSVSSAVAAALAQAAVDPSRIIRIPNPLDTSDHSNSPAEGSPATILPSNSDDGPILVCAGRISPMKGQDLLVEALPAVKERFPNLKCFFAGRIGSDSGLEDTVRFHSTLINRIAALGLESNIVFLGEVEDLPSLLASADLCVQPSRTESFGRVVCESLLTGTPVAAFAVGGIPESAGPGALLARAGDGGALSAAIIRILDNPALARELAANGRTY